MRHTRRGVVTTCRSITTRKRKKTVSACFVVDLVQPQIDRIFFKDVGEDFPDPVHDDLPVGIGHVDGALHGGKIILSLPGFKGGTGQLPITYAQSELGAHNF